MSKRREVPRLVPSVVQTSVPLDAERVALKRTLVLLGARVNPEGDELKEPVAMSLMRDGEGGEPVMRQGSEPNVPLLAEK